MVLITRVVGIVVFDESLTQRSIGGFASSFAGTESYTKPKRNQR